MRLKLGRPDIGGYRDRFDVPAASPDSELTVMWLGVSTMLVRVRRKRPCGSSSGTALSKA